VALLSFPRTVLRLRTVHGTDASPDRQYVTFVDPKGVRNLRGVDDPKISFYNTIKEIEVRLGDPEVVLNSFIISNTSYDEVSFWGYSKKEFEDRHVLFQEEDKHTYVRTMLDRVLTPAITA
jgi:hypothetical protein